MHETLPKVGKSVLPLLKVLRRLKRHKLAVTGGAIILALCFIALFAPFLAPNDPLKQQLSLRLLPPGPEYWLGTDNLGRCIFSRLI